jgi:hypothetical protein
VMHPHLFVADLIEATIVYRTEKVTFERRFQLQASSFFPKLGKDFLYHFLCCFDVRHKTMGIGTESRKILPESLFKSAIVPQVGYLCVFSGH